MTATNQKPKAPSAPHPAIRPAAKDPGLYWRIKMNADWLDSDSTEPRVISFTPTQKNVLTDIPVAIATMANRINAMVRRTYHFKGQTADHGSRYPRH